jgi:hypothetical protein
MELPDKRTALLVNAITITVVPRKIDFPVVGAERKPYRSVSIIMPQFPSGINVESNHLILIIETNEYPVACHYGFKEPVKMHQVLVERIIPHRNPLSIFNLPLRIEICGKLPRRYSRTIMIVPPCRPIVRACKRMCTNEQKEYKLMYLYKSFSAMVVVSHHKFSLIDKLRYCYTSYYVLKNNLLSA